MKRKEHILVAHDFSEGSHLALDYGIELAVENSAELHFLHVEVLHDDTGILNQKNKTKVQVLREKLKEDILESLKKQNLQYSDLEAITYTVLHEVAAAPAILEYCETHGVDMIVLGTHGRRGLKRKLLGSVAEEVARLATCTVFTVRDKAEFKSMDENLGLITVPIDFSDDSRHALTYAKDFAFSFGARLDLVHVIEENLHPIFYNAGVSSVFDMHPDIEERVLQALELFFAETKGSPVDVNYTVVRGHPVDEIIGLAESMTSDLIIIASHGLSGLDRMVMGSVTEKIIRHAPCPVITVKNRKSKAQAEAEVDAHIASTEA